jgi:hypothetical protein
LGREIVIELLKEAANSATPGNCSGQRSGKAWSCFSKLSKDASKCVPSMGEAMFQLISRRFLLELESQRHGGVQKNPFFPIDLDSFPNWEVFLVGEVDRIFPKSSK